MRPPEKLECVIIRAVNPESVVCPESILVNALTTLGIPLHPTPGMDYVDFREPTPEGGVRRILQWALLSKSADGVYSTNQVIRWWNDDAWLAANPVHEITVLKNGLGNMMRMAARIRNTPPTHIYRSGQRRAHIPENLSPEKREAALAKLKESAS